MYYPPYIIRTLDKRILKRNENNHYILINDPVPYEWKIEHLTEPNFIKIWNEEDLRQFIS
jgi:hypothetical protein